ncbi:YlbE-like family protein [Bacillus sp. B190/17]|uniref:YlbE-like family protein n=1 Tax=Bacillus lumedeiriae TaxID=3058829 RepID=A0ABW8I897_9BACI
MRQEIMEMIRKNKDWHEYLRREPSWYRLLGRNPQRISSFEGASLQYHKKTFPDRLGRLNDGLQVASALMYMMQSQIPQSSAANEPATDTEAKTSEMNENNQ